MTPWMTLLEMPLYEGLWQDRGSVGPTEGTPVPHATTPLKQPHQHLPPSLLIGEVATGLLKAF